MFLIQYKLRPVHGIYVTGQIVEANQAMLAVGRVQPYVVHSAVVLPLVHFLLTDVGVSGVVQRGEDRPFRPVTVINDQLCWSIDALFRPEHKPIVLAGTLVIELDQETFEWLAVSCCLKTRSNINIPEGSRRLIGRGRRRLQRVLRSRVTQGTSAAGPGKLRTADSRRCIVITIPVNAIPRIALTGALVPPLGHSTDVHGVLLVVGAEQVQAQSR